MPIPLKVKLVDGEVAYVAKTGVGAHLYYQGSSDPDLRELLKKILAPGQVFFDVGAHLGEFTMLGSRLVTSEGEVHSFEPVENLAQLIKRNLNENGINNVFVNCVVVTNITGQVKFELHDELARSSIVSHPKLPENHGYWTREDFQSVTLDRYIRNQSIPDLIKVDVEGAELYVLLGALSLLALDLSEAPMFILEWAPHNYAKYDYTGEHLLDFLRSYGYSAYHYTRQNGIQEVIKISSLNTTDNILASKRTFK